MNRPVRYAMVMLIAGVACMDSPGPLPSDVPMFSEAAFQTASPQELSVTTVVESSQHPPMPVNTVRRLSLYQDGFTWSGSEASTSVGDASYVGDGSGETVVLARAGGWSVWPDASYRTPIPSLTRAQRVRLQQTRIDRFPTHQGKYDSLIKGKDRPVGRALPSGEWVDPTRASTVRTNEDVDRLRALATAESRLNSSQLEFKLGSDPRTFVSVVYDESIGAVIRRDEYLNADRYASTIRDFVPEGNGFRLTHEIVESFRPDGTMRRRIVQRYDNVLSAN